MTDTGTAYQELFVLTDDEYTGPPGTRFACSICGTPVDDRPCPDHAPMQVPGLRLVDCDATPPHIIFVHDADDYGVPCHQCRLAEYAELERQERQCRHWRWRAWRVTGLLASLAYGLGVSSGNAYSYGDGHNGCVTGVRLRGSRPYVLGVSRDVWRCWFRGHRRGEPVGAGMCGKCVPWPCCDAVTEAHADGCREADLPVTFDSSIPPGGFVCAVAAPAGPDGICGMPVESEPCGIHAPKRVAR